MKNVSLFLLSFLLFSFQEDSSSYFLNNGEYLVFKAGHSSSDCNGSGESTIMFDALIEQHLSCQGFGSACTYKVKIELLSQDQSIGVAVKSAKKHSVKIYFDNGFSEDEFKMPKRSIFSAGDGVYINIPSGILNKEGDYYEADGVSFSAKALFKNE